MIKSDMYYNLTYAKGDTFTVQYDFGEKSIKGSAVATFSIRNKNALVLDCSIDATGKSLLLFSISAEDMGKLPSGKYYYDCVIQYSDGRKFTLDYLRELRIVDVAHELDYYNFPFPIHANIQDIKGDKGDSGAESYSSFAEFPTVGDPYRIYIDEGDNCVYRFDAEKLKYYCVGRDYTKIEVINGGIKK